MAALATRSLSYSEVPLFQEDEDDMNCESGMDHSSMCEEFSVLIQNIRLAVLQESELSFSRDENLIECDDEPAVEAVDTQTTAFHEQSNTAGAEIEPESCGETTENYSAVDDNEDNSAQISSVATESNIAIEVEVEGKTKTEIETTSAANLPCSASRKKRPSRKERHQRKERKYKQVDPSEFGFHLSCEPRPVENLSNANEDAELSPAEDENQKSSDAVTDNTESPVEFEDSSVGSDAKLQQNDDIGEIENPVDDEHYFADLGIDVTDGGTFLEWDDIRFSQKQSGTKNEIPSKDVARKPKTSHKVTTVMETHEFCLPNLKITTHQRIQLFEVECNSSRKFYLRNDKHRKIEKVHKAVKTSHCTLDNITNNHGRKMMYMHHRLFKKINLDLGFRLYGRSHIPPMPKQDIDLRVAKAIRIRTVKPVRAPPAQNLNHVLHETNLPSAIEMDLASFLLSIQNRELTPEDYDMLLRLDDSVKAKTVSKNVLNNLKTETIGSELAESVVTCVICMELYTVGQVRKFLPCGHDFHSDCVDSWLANSSQNCPLDGLPIVDS